MLRKIINGNILRRQFFTFLILLFVIFTLVINTNYCGEITTRAARSYDFSIAFLVDTNTIEPDQQELFDLKVTNLGTNPDTYNLAVSGVPTGWSVKLMNIGKEITQLNLDEGQSATIQVIIKVTASGSAMITVTATSDIAGSKSDGIEITAGYVIRLNCENSQQFLAAGESTVFNLNLTNHQETGDVVTLETDTVFEIGNHPDETEWVISFADMSPTIPANSSIITYVTIYAPLNAVPPQKVIFKVIGTSGGTDETFYSNQIEVTIKNIYNITNLITPESASANTGETVNYTIKITNHGNSVDNVKLTTLDNPDDWAISLMIDEQAFVLNNDEIVLEPTESKTINAELTIPEAAPAGNHNIELKISSNGGIQGVVNITTYVEQDYSLDLELHSELNIVNIAATTYLKIKAVNTGNGQDTLTLQIPDNYLPDGWEIYFHSIETSEIINFTKNIDFNQPISIIDTDKTKFVADGSTKFTVISVIMGSGQSAIITLGVTTPSQGSWGNQSFIVYGETHNIVNKDTKLLTVAVILKTSDLEFEGVPELSSENLSVGDTLEIKFNIKNNFHVSARNFKVNLYLGNLPGEQDKLIESQSIDVLQPNTSRTVTLKWEIPGDSAEGTYLLKIKLEGDIISSTDVPEKNIYADVGAQDDSGGDESKTIAVLIAIIIIVIILVVVMFVIFKKKFKPEESEPETKSKINEFRAGTGKKKPGRENRDLKMRRKAK